MNIDFDLILPEIFLSLSIMTLLMIGVFKKNSSQLVFSLSILSLFISSILIFNLSSVDKVYVFNRSYIIDNISNFMKILTTITAIFVMIISSNFLKILKIYKIEYPILILCSVLGMMVMISSNDLIVFYLGLELQS